MNTLRKESDKGDNPVQKMDTKHYKFVRMFAGGSGRKEALSCFQARMVDKEKLSLSPGVLFNQPA